MKKTIKQFYERPVLCLIEIEPGGITCQSNYMKFGGDNNSGSIDDEDVIDGGSF